MFDGYLIITKKKYNGVSIYPVLVGKPLSNKKNDEMHRAKEEKKEKEKTTVKWRLVTGKY